MISDLNSGIINDNMGNKAKGLIKLKALGFNIPTGIVIDSDEYISILQYNNIDQEVKVVVESLIKKENNLQDVSDKLQNLFSNIIIPEDVKNTIKSKLKDGVKYAVRSSGMMEDMPGHSFAGQYDTLLDVEGKDNVIKAIIDCYKGLYNINVLSYLIDNSFDLDNLKIAIVIQEMVDSKYSGVVFTVNPLTGNDREIVAEMIEGQGEQYVSGKVNANTYCYNWVTDTLINDNDKKLVDENIVIELMKQSLEIQMKYGVPCDIEYAIDNDEIYFLQVRPITKVNYSGYDKVWTIANLRDGGISSETCPKLMFSLYEEPWNNAMRKFFINCKLSKSCDLLDKFLEWYYGRAYWPLSVIKDAIEKTPGYVERVFDEQYAIKPAYEGDGMTTSYTLTTIIRGLKIVSSVDKILKKITNIFESYINECMELYNRFSERLNKDFTFEEIQDEWIDLVENHYCKYESKYFYLVYVNTVDQTNKKDFFLKYVNEEEYLDLLSGMENVAHMKPIIALWNISRKIKEDPAEYEYWTKTSVEEIVEKINNDMSYMPLIGEYIKEFGYHSDRELTLTVPCYAEDISSVILTIKDNIILEDKYSPIEEIRAQKTRYENMLRKIERKVSKSKFKKVKAKIEESRKRLWCREELKDISTRYYYLIRMYTLKLAEKYVENGVIKDFNDIWHVSKNDIIKIRNNELSKEELCNKINVNKGYYKSFSNYVALDEIGAKKIATSTLKKGSDVKGTGCNGREVTARARVLRDSSEIHKIRKDEILVTRFTDTGWTPKFAKLAGVITETGGILCHAAVVSREYGIPCIVCAYDATIAIQDGDIITMNGSTGQIKIVERSEK